MGWDRVDNQLKHANKIKNVRFFLSHGSVLFLASKKMFALYAEMFAMFAKMFAWVFARTKRTHVYKTCSFVRHRIPETVPDLGPRQCQNWSVTPSKQFSPSLGCLLPDQAINTVGRGAAAPAGTFPAGARARARVKEDWEPQPR
jgi:hypothetical protein